ncbi:ATPase, T2SS/T4P/T4SS family [Bacillaceae bacterium CLA-AA-H227]|uniref:CpaF family protein n=2 Tax=Robertmurraya TaxID=2837507 RepID=A0A4V5P0M8_9BACI|nr:ATPase, T2SS/T4P/T4SS family [Robertmurraya kyonggiensis]TKC15190.1 CpaF family protein [Robertmurraya kyonggiensis]
MKNSIRYDGLVTEERNVINLERLLFQKVQQNQLKPKIKMSNSINQQITDHIKEYLSQEQYRELLRDSFGNRRKQGQLREVIYSYVSSKGFLTDYSTLITEYSLDQVTDYLVEKIAGLDVLQPLTELDTITDIQCIGWDNIWVDDIYKGQYKTNFTFDSEQDYLDLCNRFAFASGKPYSMAKPSVDAQFPYMRVNIVGQDLDTKTSMSIRIISKKLRLSEDYMIKSGYANKSMIEFLKATFAFESHLISGATGTGKTELLRYFSKYTRGNSNIIMIEDVPETYLDELYPDKPIKMWKNREASDDEKRTFGYRYHIRNAMRQNPIYIMLQESRGEESFDVMKAATTGHIVDTTVHSDSTADAILRFIDLCQEAYNHPAEYYGRRIIRGFGIGVHVKRYGTVRRISQITEYVDYVDGNIIENVLFQFDELSQVHIQVDKMSPKLWNKIRDSYKDFEELQHLAPAESLLR